MRLQSFIKKKRFFAVFFGKTRKIFIKLYYPSPLFTYLKLKNKQIPLSMFLNPPFVTVKESCMAGPIFYPIPLALALQ